MKRIFAVNHGLSATRHTFLQRKNAQVEKRACFLCNLLNFSNLLQLPYKRITIVTLVPNSK